MEENLLSTSQAVDFSLIALFFRATITVKIVMLVLVASSFWSWSIIIQKSIDYSRAKKDKGMFLDEFWSGIPLEELYKEKKDQQAGICEQIFCSAINPAAMPPLNGNPMRLRMGWGWGVRDSAISRDQFLII